MDNKKLQELINKEIDGLNTPEESKQLKEYLRRNPEAENLYNDLCKLSESLNKVEKVNPPSDLKKTILNSIDVKKYAQKERKPFKFFELISGYRFNFRYAYIFIVGLALGVFIYYSLFDSVHKPDTSRLIGTMIINETSEYLEPVSKIHIHSNDISGTVSVKSKENILFVEFELKTKRYIETVIESIKNDLDFLALSRLNNNNLQCTVDKKTIHIRHKGESNYIVFLTEPVPGIPQLDLKFYANGSLLMKKNLFLNNEN